MTPARAAVAALVILLAAAACSRGDGEEPGSAGVASSATTTATTTAASSERTDDACRENRVWTSCPVADWAARIAEHAGFTVTGDTQSALTVEGGRSSFYLWATPLTAPVAELAADEGWRLLGRSAGVDVYGDPGLWRWWTTQGQIVWTKVGPTEDSRSPTLAELAPLIRASRELAAPPTK
jgi:hypothetical protein